MGKYFPMLSVCFLFLLVGCQQEGARIYQPAEPVVSRPLSSPPAQDVPPAPPRENPYIETSVQPEFRPAVPDDQKASLMYEARLDLLRIMLCSEEVYTLDGDTIGGDFGLQAAKEHFSEIGFRVVEGFGCPGYNATASQLITAARERDIDMFVLFTGNASKVDTFGNFHSYQSQGRGKAAQIADNELITTTSATVRGKRALNEQQAAESALRQCGRELSRKISDEILRKSARGLLLRRIEVDGLRNSADVDYIRVGLAGKPGVGSVDLVNWDRNTGRAVFWVRVDASAKENLAAYMENIENIKLKVERLDTTGVDARRGGLLE